jgi:hypothetical protein
MECAVDWEEEEGGRTRDVRSSWPVKMERFENAPPPMRGGLVEEEEEEDRSDVLDEEEEEGEEDDGDDDEGEGEIDSLTTLIAGLL